MFINDILNLLFIYLNFLSFIFTKTCFLKVIISFYVKNDSDFENSNLLRQLYYKFILI